jgi:hypothetical protein
MGVAQTWMGVSGSDIDAISQKDAPVACAWPRLSKPNQHHLMGGLRNSNACFDGSIATRACPGTDRRSKGNDFDVLPYTTGDIGVVSEPAVQLLASLEVAENT